MTDVNGFKIVAISAPTEESEARLKELQEKKELTKEECSEIVNLAMRNLWCCEC